MGADGAVHVMRGLSPSLIGLFRGVGFQIFLLVLCGFDNLGDWILLKAGLFSQFVFAPLQNYPLVVDPTVSGCSILHPILQKHKHYLSEELQ